MPAHVVDSDSILDPWLNRDGMAINTDLYELTMAAGFWMSGKARDHVSFEYFFRDLPEDNGFAIVAGLEQVLKYIERFKFAPDDIEYLRSLHVFPNGFLDWLSTMTISCRIWAMLEGSVVFPNSPVIRIDGPLIEAQLLETFILNAMNYPILIATKAARVCHAADGDPVIEFGLRRAQGPDGGLTGARAAYIGGCVGSSNCLAGKTYGIPVKGTHAHSWVMAYPTELEAFRAYAAIYPHNCILLVDTYDVIHSGVPHAIQVFTELRRAHPDIRASIRIDSGDLAKLSKQAWYLLTEAGFQDPLIVASNDLDESLIADIKRQGAKINAWGVGTHLITSGDSPALGGVYKLVALKSGSEWQPRIKMSDNFHKLTNPGRKQVFRCINSHGEPVMDILYPAGGSPPDSSVLHAVDQHHLLRQFELHGIHRTEPLLHLVMENGKRTMPEENIHTIRTRVQDHLGRLPEELKRLRNPHRYVVALSPELAAVKRSLVEARGGRVGDSVARENA